MPSRPKTRINASGEVVRVGDDEPQLEGSAPLLRSGNSLDVFGFNLDVRQFLIALGALSLMIGIRGVLMLLGALGLYTLWSRIAPASSISSATSSSGTTSSGGSGGSWGRSGGPRIKGIGDLPCDPKGG